MLKICKYKVVVDDQFVLEMPTGAQILTVQTQQGWPQLWALVDSEEEKKEYRLFRLYGTGDPTEEIRGKLEYIATFQMMGGDVAFHLFQDVGVNADRGRSDDGRCK